ncbi:E3 ubiquitin-protein ligase ATL42-like [Benincasa hispida]|uniref:E3 ubiquitin-protein ligase ATL42-like n=1 Tax=Benincasa hispida TaxID=102211 RepID=UPI00190132C8|nr:E3 ubiquitin-protein ligase ATL42-like [Benincasa hispida]
MIRLSSIVFFLFFVFFVVEAQVDSQDAENSAFQPSLGFVIGILGVMFMLTFILLVYAKYCHRRSSVRGDDVTHPRQIRTSSRFSGIDKTVIESLPFFRFSTLKGSKEGLECAVCLSKFEDIEILRMLPKCKHAFHINCIDHWLEKHASCPLCRQRVGSEDLKLLSNSNSMRFLLSNLSELKQDSNIELFVQREEEEEQQQQQLLHGSSRFSIGRSFRKILKSDKEEEMLIQKAYGNEDENMKNLHRHNHKIIVSDFVFMNRWSNVSSSDLMFLNKEMIDAISSSRFTSFETDIEQSSLPRSMQIEEILKVNEEMEIKRSFDQSKLNTINQSNNSILGFPSTSQSSTNPSQTTRITGPDARRSVSEITGRSRFGDDVGLYTNFNRKDESGESSDLGNNVKQERTRQIWYPIAKRTVQWFANRETRFQPAENRQQTVETV